MGMTNDLTLASTYITLAEGTDLSITVLITLLSKLLEVSGERLWMGKKEDEIEYEIKVAVFFTMWVVRAQVAHRSCGCPIPGSA